MPVERGVSSGKEKGDLRSAWAWVADLALKGDHVGVFDDER